MSHTAFLDTLKFDSAGLVPTIIQDAESGEVLMFAFSNREALSRALSTGRMHFYSRSRQKIWLKGEESGHFQDIVEVRADCDRDALLVRVRQHGGACHTGFRSCFFTKLDPLEPAGYLEDGHRIFDAGAVYAKKS